MTQDRRNRAGHGIEATRRNDGEHVYTDPAPVSATRVADGRRSEGDLAKAFGRGDYAGDGPGAEPGTTRVARGGRRRRASRSTACEHACRAGSGSGAARRLGSRPGRQEGHPRTSADASPCGEGVEAGNAAGPAAPPPNHGDRPRKRRRAGGHCLSGATPSRTVNVGHALADTPWRVEPIQVDCGDGPCWDRTSDLGIKEASGRSLGFGESPVFALDGELGLFGVGGFSAGFGGSR